MATRSLQAGKRVALLILMEMANLPPFEANLTFIYGEESYLNPPKRYDAALARYDEAYDGRSSVDVIPGEHGQLFVEPNVHYLASMGGAHRGKPGARTAAPRPTRARAIRREFVMVERPFVNLCVAMVRDARAARGLLTMRSMGGRDLSLGLKPQTRTSS
jgi:hypothetical protein